MDKLLLDQRYTQAEVLAVTQLRKELLQTWVNRGVVTLGEQNPGSGKRRLYSAIDIVKFALLRRIADLGLALEIGRDLAADAEQLLRDHGKVDWDLHLCIRRRDASAPRPSIQFITSSGYSTLSLKYGATVGDAFDMRVSRFTEPTEAIFPRRHHEGEERPMDEERRVAFARAGVHAEPAVLFPFGEIVNSALLQLEQLREGSLPSPVEVMRSLGPVRRSAAGSRDNA